jgi:uncharacterized protein (DUF885 family)
MPIRSLFALCLLATAAHANDADKKALALGEAVVHEFFVDSPARATMLRVPGARYDELPPDSLAGVRARQEREDALSKQLAAIDSKALTDAGARTAIAIAREFLEGEKRTRVCRWELWSVSPAFNGWQIGMSILAQLQPVGTDELRKQALARFGKLPGYVDDQIAALREGLKQNIVAPEPTVRAALQQIDALEKMPVEASPFFTPALSDGTPAFKEQFARLVREQLQPALHRYGEFVRNEYLPHARKAVGLGALPFGDACYRASLRRFTTLDLDPKAVHELGLKRLDELETEMKEIAKRSFGGAELPALMQKLRSDPKFVYKDRDDITKQSESALARAKAALPSTFHLLPKADFRLEPIPSYQEKQASPHYLAAALDGSRPAAYRVRYYEPQKQSRANGESIAFHEVIPGHHLQIAIANERKEIPPIARYIGNSGFSEGWGLYAERLSDEMHLYSDDLERLGMLSMAAVRAVRLVVDSGMHALGWDRQKAIDTMMRHTTLSVDQAGAEIDRYISVPGQATAYTVGMLEIFELREKAKKELGAKFDLREFHDRVLENGAVPLGVLRENVDRWIAARKKS